MKVLPMSPLMCGAVSMLALSPCVPCFLTHLCMVSVQFIDVIQLFLSYEQVFVYHKAFPMPVLSFKFNITDPLSGQEVDDATQFLSSVCWRGQSSTLVAANSTGNIKLLEMV